MKGQAGENSPLHIEEPQIAFARVRCVVAWNDNGAAVGGQPSRSVVSRVSQSRELFAGAIQPNQAAGTRKAVPVDEYPVLRDGEVSQSLPLVVLHLGRYRDWVPTQRQAVGIKGLGHEVAILGEEEVTVRVSNAGIFFCDQLRIRRIKGCGINLSFRIIAFYSEVDKVPSIRKEIRPAASGVGTLLLHLGHGHGLAAAIGDTVTHALNPC